MVSKPEVVLVSLRCFSRTQSLLVHFYRTDFSFQVHQESLCGLNFISTRTAMETDIKWLWKSTETEAFYEVYTISYQLTIATREPLLEEHLIQTLTHLFRKLPLLRACYGQRNGEKWFREMTEMILDFEVVSDTTPQEVHKRLQSYRYDLEKGPLWCVKLLSEPPSSPEIPAGVDMKQFCYVYTLFLGLHHGITDGTSNMKICGFLVQLLDAVMGRKAIDNAEQLGVFISDEKTHQVQKEKLASMETDAELRRRWVEEVQSRYGRFSLVKSIYKGAGEKVPRTGVLERTLDTDSTMAFIKRCRSEGVTVNSAFTALGCMATVDLLADGGLDQDKYDIRSEHVLNARRYWDGDTSQYLGCHILPLMSVDATAPRNTNGKFWDFARSVHQEFLKKVNEGAPMLVEAAKHFMPANPDFDPTFEYEFCVSNLGNVTGLVTEGGDHVQPLHVIRTVALHGVPCTWSLLVHTFRGRLILALICNMSTVNSEMAKKFCDGIFHHLKEVL